MEGERGAVERELFFFTLPGGPMILLLDCVLVVVVVGVETLLHYNIIGFINLTTNSFWVGVGEELCRTWGG